MISRRFLLLWMAAIVPVTGWAGSAGSPRPEIGSATGMVYRGGTERIRGFDPVTSADVPSASAIYKVYEGLYEYEYLVRPYTVRPALAEGMPEVSADGLTYTFRIKKGVRFADDPCFPDGKGREVTAADFIYSWKRVADVRTKSNCYWIFDGRIAGMDEYHEASTKRQVSYDEPVEGFQAPDRYTLVVKLKEPYPQLIWVLTMSYTFVVPREAVEKYGDEFLNHPVGTGAYRVADWRYRNYGITFRANPTQGSASDRAKGLLEYAGQRLPFIQEVQQYVIADTSTEWLVFLSGALAQAGIAKDNFNAVISGQKELTPELINKGIRLEKAPQLWTTYMGFNMEDPVVGASADPAVDARHRKLRQALCHTVDIAKWCEFYNDRQMPANSPIPPGMSGYEAKDPLPYPLDVAKAKQLLAEAGYPDGIDPATGQRLQITMQLGSASEPEERQSMDLMASFWRAIGVTLIPEYNNWPEFLKKMERKQQQMFRLGWVADYPDAENYLQLFYSKSISPGPNHTNYSNPKFDALFEKARQLQDSPERTALYRQCIAMVVDDAVWITLTYPLAFGLQQQWFSNYKFHDFPYPNMKFYRTAPNWEARIP
jgi:ABC-type transport system substrate-binding protein